MERIGIALIGFGEWPREAYAPTLRALADRVRVVAVAARSEETRESARAVFGPDLRTPAGYREALGDPAVDAVMVAVPNALHREVALAVLAAGKHLFLEPPVALTPEDVDAVLDAAEASGRVTQVDFELRYLPVCREIERVVRGGGVGRPLSAGLELRADWAYGGGAFNEPTAREGFYPWLGAWYLDVLDVLLAGPEPRGAQVAGVRAMNGPMLDHGHALIEYEGGAVGRFTHTIISTRPEVAVTAHLLGTEGELWADLQAGTLVRHGRGGTAERVEVPAAQPVHGWAGMRESIEGFVDAIAGRGPVLGTPAVARRVHRALFACHAADQGSGPT